ncbi:hypothetical protein D6810_01470, partial [Candidatus Dojkabacteria bacterium]
MNKLLNAIFPFRDFLYILQLEEYSSERFIKWLPKFFFRRNIERRQSLVFTKRVKRTLALAVCIYLLSITLVITIVEDLKTILLLILLTNVFIPIYVFLSNLLLQPFFEKLKAVIRSRSKNLIKNLKELKVIVIAGSYGKTTIKNFIFQLLKYSHEIQMISGNINTPTGIANWIINNLRKNTKILVAEVDAYQIGEIKQSCSILSPDYCIITNIGDQHLERFKNESNLAKALFEAFENSKKDAFLLTDKE